MGCISHNGRPNHSHIDSRRLASLRIVLSVRPADARASTNSDSTSVSNAASSSSVQRRPLLAQVAHQRQRQLTPLSFTPAEKPSA